VGKLDSDLGTWGRVGATLAAMWLGRERVAAWAERGSGRRAAAGCYVTHDRRGAVLLEQAGSDTLTRDWAAQHHLPDRSWTVPAHIGAALCAADDD
jgi:hypothetical protein